MKRYPLILIIFTALALGAGNVRANGTAESYSFFDLKAETQVPFSRTIEELKKNRLIIVGEHHNDATHHFAQLLIIRSLYDSGLRVAVGLEMFRSDSQRNLDTWVRGETSEKEFEEIYYDNWNYDWNLYRMIFVYARDKKIPLIGLNVPRAITQQVAREGFQSLSEEKRGNLPDVVCRVDDDYMSFIKRAYGAHEHGQLNFNYFCEAQLVWDNIMAINALKYLEMNRDTIIIILAGAGHAWKKGIPEQIRRRSEVAYSVILPESPDIIEPGMVRNIDADYILLGLSSADFQN